MTEPIQILITADAGPAQAGLGRVDQALNRTAGTARTSAAQTAAAMRTLPAQFTDIATQLQGGANPLTILLQQGGQIKDSFGGVRPALQGIGAAIGPLLTNPVTLAALAVTGLGAAFLAGQSQSAELQRAITLTGNAAGLTAGQVDQLSQRIATSGAVTIGAARDLTQALVAAGGLTGQALESAAAAAVQLSRLSGRSAADVAKDFAGIGDNVTAFAQKANRAYNFLTAAQFDQIRALQAQGQAQAAAKLTLDALAESLEQRTAPSLGLIDRLLKAGATTWSNWWDAAKGIGRAESAEERLASLRKEIQDVDDLRARMLGRDKPVPTLNTQNRTEQAVNLQAQIRAQEQAVAFGQQAAAADADRAARNQREIEETSAGHQQALSGIDKAGAARRLAETSLSLGTARALYERAYAREEITATEHAAALRAIDLARLDAEEKNLDRLKGIEARRQISSPDDKLNQQAALSAFETQRLGIQERRVALQLKEAEAVKVNDKGVNLFAGGDDSAEILRRVQASRDAQQQLAETAEQFRIGQIRGDEARGRALIDLEERTLRKRLDLQALGDDARRQAESDLADYIALRNEQLTDQLKPEWERMVDEWKDSQRVMRDATNNAMSGLLASAEDAFVRFAQTGKLSVKGMVDVIISELARAQFRAAVGSNGSGVTGLAGLIANLFGAGQYSGTSTNVSAPNYENSFDLMDSAQPRANGGPVSAGSMYEVNERGIPELLNVGGRQFLMMAGQGGYVTPAGGGGAAAALTAGGGAPSGGVIININNARGSDTEVQATARNEGGQTIIEVVVDKVRNAIAGDIARGSGTVPNALQRTYGLNRAAGAY